MAKTDTTTLPPLAMQSPSSSIPRHTTSTRSSRKPKASPWWAASSCNDRDAELIGGGSASWENVESGACSELQVFRW
jgi:hypothetical protein